MPVIFFLLLFLSCTTTVLSITDDETVLLKIKQQLGDPDSLSNWIGSDFCDSSYVSCFSTVDRVQALVFTSLSITAHPFPDAICNLTELQYLGIYDIPQLYGPIPSCLTELSELRYLSIVNTSLSGSVPNFSNNMNIEYIDLSNNYFSGTIPLSLSTLPKLSFLVLSFNSLTGTIPPDLVHGENPMLGLSHNNLTGELPKCYGWINFHQIDVGNNQLTGDASFLFGKQKMTRSIILANNSFEFDLSYVEFSDNISEFDLSYNKIYGRVPDSFATAGSLANPNLSFNRLCGELPQGYNMCRFSPAVFANNTCLFGIPQSPCFSLAPTPGPIWDMSPPADFNWAPELAPESEPPF